MEIRQGKKTDRENRELEKGKGESMREGEY